MKMTREDYIERMNVLMAEVKENVNQYNIAYGEKRYDDAAAYDAKTKEGVDEYNAIAQMLCFDECMNAENPMLAAVLKKSFAVIGVKDTAVGEEVKILKRVVVGDEDDENGSPKSKMIDLLALDKYVRDREGHGIGVDPHWNAKLEKLNLLFGLNHAIELGKSDEFIKSMGDCYYLREKSRETALAVKNPSVKNPTSKTSLLKAVREVVSAMLGDEYGADVIGCDVNWIMKGTATLDVKTLTAKCAKHKAMRGIMVAVCNRVVNHGEYDVDFKKTKSK